MSFVEWINDRSRITYLMEITIKGKKRLKKSATLSMHVEREIFEKFRSRCITDLKMSYTEVIRNFIEGVVTGKIALIVGE